MFKKECFRRTCVLKKEWSQKRNLSKANLLKANISKANFLDEQLFKTTFITYPFSLTYFYLTHPISHTFAPQTIFKISFN